MTDQLTLDGGAVPVTELPGRVPTGVRLTAVQAAVLAHIDKHGSIRTSEAGRIAHGARRNAYGSTAGRKPGECEHAFRHRVRGVVPAAAASDRFDWGEKDGRLGCCPWAGADGLSVMKRLRDRGLVVQDHTRGPWRRP